MTQQLGQPGLKPNDGPAFPGAHENYFQFGMSLRDYFAGKALVALIEKWDGEDGRKIKPVLCEAAYAFADAMLAERAK